MIDMEDGKKKIEEQLDRSEAWIRDRLGVIDLLDDDGYPTKEVLDVIREWTFRMSDKELFEFVKSIWWMPEWGWKACDAIDEVTGKTNYCYYISTGGWSGNESIIQAMQENKYFFWHMHWVQSRRGGHYIFELRNDDERLG